MSLKYLPEHIENAKLTLELAQKKVAHLAHTRGSLFAHKIDLQWVQLLDQNEDLAEKVEAFISRFGRLQDNIGEKLIPRFAMLLGDRPKSLLDILAYAERLGWVDNAETFVGARKLRNLLVHEYMTDPNLFLENLHEANTAAQMLMDVVARIAQHAETIGIMNQSNFN